MRAELEELIAGDLRAITSASGRMGQYYARKHGLSTVDMHALLLLGVAENAQRPLTAGQLSRRLGVTAAAITYIVDRMVDAGQVWREPDPVNRRKVLLRLHSDAMVLGHDFFGLFRAHLHAAVADQSDDALRYAHEVMRAMTLAMSECAAEFRV